MRTLHKILIALAAIFMAGLATLSAHAFSNSWQLQASLEKGGSVKLQDAVTMNFSFPVITLEVEKNINISPEASVTFSWQNNNKKLVIAPKTHWEAQTNYEISINGGKSILYSSFDSKLTFFTEKIPALESITPIAGEKNVATSLQDPVTVRFNQPLNDYSVKFIVIPDKKLTYEISDDKKSIRLLATDDFKFSTSYNIQVYLKHKSDDKESFKKVGETSFMTAPPPAPVVVDWAKSFADRAIQAKEITRPQITSGKYIDINLAQQVMVIFQEGQALDSYVISSGKRGMETPTGTFKIENKTPRAWSKEFGLWMPNWMAILASGKIGIHELPEWPGGYKEGVAHLGTPVSHGCVRLGVGSAKRVYDWADLDTPVVVHY